jgi:hypothetical protein
MLRRLRDDGLIGYVRIFEVGDENRSLASLVMTN